MPDLGLTVTVTRTLLGLADLNINDHSVYALAPGTMGAQVTWNRTTVSSPYLDDAVTVNRMRGKVNEAVIIEVLGVDQAALASNVDALIKAFSQDHYTLTIGIGSQTYAYRCEAADYQMTWTGPRFVARQVQVVFQVPRSPIPTQGPI